MALKVGFVGTGGIATRHLDNTARRKDIQMVGYADVALARATECADKYGGAAYDDFIKLYDEQKPDVIVICTPPFAHGQIEEEAAARGIHFFIEKPVAVSMELANRVQAAVKKSGIATQVGYMFRFSEATKKVRELLQGRAIAMVQAHYYMPGLPPPAWWPFMAKGGGQLVEQATHMLDLGRFFAGDVESVIAMTSTVRQWTPIPEGYESPDRMLAYADEMDIPDVTGMVMRYKSGALGTLSCSIVPQGKWDNGFKVVAEGLLVTVEGPNASWIGDEVGEMKAADRWPEYVLYELYDQVIAGSIETSVPYIEGVKSLGISLAGYESVKRGGCPVRVAELM